MQSEVWKDLLIHLHEATWMRQAQNRKVKKILYCKQTMSTMSSKVVPCHTKLLVVSISAKCKAAFAFSRGKKQIDKIIKAT